MGRIQRTLNVFPQLFNNVLNRSQKHITHTETVLANFYSWSIEWLSRISLRLGIALAPETQVFASATDLIKYCLNYQYLSATLDVPQANQTSSSAFHYPSVVVTTSGFSEWPPEWELTGTVSNSCFDSEGEKHNSQWLNLYCFALYLVKLSWIWELKTLDIGFSKISPTNS